ncbi:hypothetical protein BV917_15335 [Leptospira santarosai serovar Guaricura]|nr:hypothetical protein BV917_15335 [Leptospira santarosai serovar Guaricura]
MPSLKEELDIALLEKHQAWHEARGRLSPPKILTTIPPNRLTTRRELESVRRFSSKQEFSCRSVESRLSIGKSSRGCSCSRNF